MINLATAQIEYSEDQQSLPYDFNVTHRKLFFILYCKCDVIVSYPGGESSFTHTCLEVRKATFLTPKTGGESDFPYLQTGGENSFDNDSNIKILTSCLRTEAKVKAIK